MQAYAAAIAGAQSALDHVANDADSTVDEVAQAAQDWLLAEATARGDRDTVIFLRADKSVPYGEMMEVMNLLRGAGYLKVALVGLEKGPTP